MSDAAPLRRALESARKQLLDLSARNRLINTRRQQSRSSSVEVVDERSREVYRILVDENKSMNFLPVPNSAIPEGQVDVGADELFSHLAQPSDESDRPSSRHTDAHLQTRLNPKTLQGRLLRLFYDARTAEEEQGTNLLHLAMGFLQWSECEDSQKTRWAPLLLVPVTLERRSATSPFVLRWSGDDLSTNLSLQTKLRAEFGIELPSVEEADELNPDAYFQAVEDAVGGMSGWRVCRDDMVLWLYSFAKLLMYRDLDPDQWPESCSLEDHPLIRTLLTTERFEAPQPLFAEDANVDELLQPIDMTHIWDADSSQIVAIEEVRRGRSLVIQGPPGTGKSQTITNLIAAAVKDGKRVLFVAEKMAALDVVARRLERAGIGDICLELHSHKAQKKIVLEELRRTLRLDRPADCEADSVCERLRSARDRLNAHARTLHEVHAASELTPFKVIGELARLRAAGVGPAPFQLRAAAHWRAADRLRLSSLVRDFSRLAESLTQPDAHPWRGVMLKAALPMDVQRLCPQLDALIEKLRVLEGQFTVLAASLRLRSSATTLRTAKQAGAMAVRFAGAPPFDCDAMADAIWSTDRPRIAELIETGAGYASAHAAIKDVVVEAAWTCAAAAMRRDLAGYGRSLLRFLNGPYRRAAAGLRGILREDPSADLDRRLEILDHLIRAQSCERKLTELDATGSRAFGRMWRGKSSDWPALSSLERWDAENLKAGFPDSYRQSLAGVEDRPAVGSAGGAVLNQVEQIKAELASLMREVDWNLSAGFSAGADPFAPAASQFDARQAPLRELIERLVHCRERADSLIQWVQYRTAGAALTEAGLSELALAVHRGGVAPERAVDCFLAACYEAVLRDMVQRHPELGAFNGISHEQVVQLFRQLDRERIRLAAREIAEAHYRGLPRGEGNYGQLGVLYREFEKKRRHLPIRQLMKQAGEVIRAIKPVFMMSPLSIAQYLEPGGVDQFDLLLIDEASQVLPEDALGAVARAKQIVVVGDSKQLPPTSFFQGSSPLDDDEDPDEGASQTGDMESVLGLCSAQGLPDRMLRWHYRSRHHSLIAVSNHEFYDSRLHVIPSPTRRTPSLGLNFHLLSDGIYDRGGSATNQLEAEAVARAVMQHAVEQPDKTLGVGAFSVKQRDAVIDALELLRRQHPESEAFFATDGPEPFFVKNLENIQGDERDVIYITVGYGKDTSGYMAMNFGPISSEGGERRLNVLITRARERTEVFSSITADDIDLTRATGRGPAALKSFLQYAQTEVLGVASPTGRGPDSPFEEAVKSMLEEYGYTVHCQVGVAGFFIDLAVVDPDAPGRYLLGIECDGRAYHSSRSARDRDRIRQAVLEDRGWTIHRIWSTDWFNQPQRECRRCLEAIKQAGRSATMSPADVPPVAVAEIPRVSDAETCETELAEPYQEATIRVNRSRPLHETPTQELAKVVARIVEVEGPIHEEEVVRRVRSAWGLDRAGSRIVAAVEAAIRNAEHGLGVRRDGRFLMNANAAAVSVRNRENVDSTTLRFVNMLPPTEVAECVRRVVVAHFGVTREEAITAVARSLGFKSTSAQLRDAIEAQIDHLIDRNELRAEDGQLQA